MGGTVSGNLQSGANSVSQVDGVSDMVPACGLCGSVGGGFRKGTMATTPLSIWEKVVLQLLPRYWTLHFLPVAAGAFQAATLVLEFRGSESD